MSAADWVLCQPPEHKHRHYRYQGSWSVGPVGAKVRLASVTQVLDAADDRLQQWMLGQAYVAGEKDGCAPGLMQRAYARGHGPEAIRDKAAALGTISHSALEAMSRGHWMGARREAAGRAQAYMVGATDAAMYLLPGKQPITAQDLWPRLTALEQFFADHTPHAKQTEVAVGSVKHVYAGTFDWFGTLLGNRRQSVLLDAKNTNMLSWRHPVQVCGYESARRECGMEPAKRLLILRLHANATYDIADVAKLGGYAYGRRVFLNELRGFRAERHLDGLIDKHKKELEP